jgi:hypothetical protein
MSTKRQSGTGAGHLPLYPGSPRGLFAGLQSSGEQSAGATVRGKTLRHSSFAGGQNHVDQSISEKTDCA